MASLGLGWALRGGSLWIFSLSGWNSYVEGVIKFHKLDGFVHTKLSTHESSEVPHWGINRIGFLRAMSAPCLSPSGSCWYLDDSLGSSMTYKHFSNSRIHLLWHSVCL